MPKSNIDSVCNPDANALNRALRQYAKFVFVKQELEVIRLKGVCRRLRGKLNRAFTEFLAEE